MLYNIACIIYSPKNFNCWKFKPPRDLMKGRFNENCCKPKASFLKRNANVYPKRKSFILVTSASVGIKCIINIPTKFEPWCTRLHVYASNKNKLHVLLKSSIRTHLRKKCVEFLMCNQINLIFSYLCVKSKLKKLRGHKVASIMAHQFCIPSHNVYSMQSISIVEWLLQHIRH